MDSATEFLFGRDVGSLSAKIPYPSTAAHLNKSSFYNHSSTIFAKAFSEGQNFTVQRSYRGNEWPLLEFWSDKVVPLREVIDKFTEPLMEEAIARRNLELSENGADVKDDASETLLAHLVKHTQGKDSLSNPPLRHCLMFFFGTLQKRIS